jgi:hypothetical protein
VAKEVTLETWSVSDVPRNIDPQMESWIHGLLRQLRRFNGAVREAITGLTLEENLRCLQKRVVYQNGVSIPWDRSLGVPVEVVVRSWTPADGSSASRISGDLVAWNYDGINVNLTNVLLATGGIAYDMVVLIYGGDA